MRSVVEGSADGLNERLESRTVEVVVHAAHTAEQKGGKGVWGSVLRERTRSVVPLLQRRPSRNGTILHLTRPSGPSSLSQLQMQSVTASSSALSPLGAPSSSTSSPSQTPAPAPSPPALTSIVSPSGYTYPPIFSFPPFFTPQPNASTLAHQLSLWTALVLSWARWHRVFELRAEDVGGADVWENKPLKRKAGRDFQRSIMQALVQGGQSLSLNSQSCQTRGNPDPSPTPLAFLCSRSSNILAPSAIQELQRSADGDSPLLAQARRVGSADLRLGAWAVDCPSSDYRRKLTTASSLHLRYQAPGRRTLF